MQKVFLYHSCVQTLCQLPRLPELQMGFNSVAKGLSRFLDQGTFEAQHF
jgi:hypothetical protein